MENNTNKRINLLQIVNGFAIGGAEKNLLELVRLTDKKKYRVVICSVGQGGPLQREFEALGLNVYVVTKKHRLDVSQVFNVAEIMRNERVDIVQMTLFYAEIIGILAALLAKVKIRISWEVYTHSKKFRHRLAYRLIYKLVNCVIAVSDETRKTIIKDRNLDVKKAITIHYGVDLDKFNASNGRITKTEPKLNRNHKTLGIVARLTDQKGHIYLIKAAPEIVKKFPSVKFVLVGDGPLRDSLKAEIAKLGLSCNFEFLGFRNDVNELLNSFDIFVLPSLFEGLPNVLLEAMACAKPIVATSVAGVPEVVVDGFTGLLVPPKNPEALAKRISALLENEELMVKMGKEARKRVENNFSLTTQVDNFQALYSKLIDSQSEKL